MANKTGGDGKEGRERERERGERKKNQGRVNTRNSRY
jgi:hypothetical protein